MFSPTNNNTTVGMTEFDCKNKEIKYAFTHRNKLMVRSLMIQNI